MIWTWPKIGALLRQPDIIEETEASASARDDVVSDHFFAAALRHIAWLVICVLSHRSGVAVEEGEDFH